MDINYLIIDPDLFIAAGQPAACGRLPKRMLEDIYDDINKKLCILLIVDQTIYQEYYNLLNNGYYIQDDIKKFLQYIMQANTSPVSEIEKTDCLSIVTINSDVDEQLSQDIINWGCNQLVELQMIGICRNIRKFISGTILIELYLVGSSYPPLRQRGLNSPDVEHSVWKKIPWMKLIKANEYPFFSHHDHNPVANTESKLFEDEVKNYLDQTVLQQHFQFYTTPRHLKKNLEWDVFLFKETDTLLQIIIGECKLRVHGNENKLIDTGEIRQLIYILNNIGEMEGEKQKKSGSNKKIQIAGFMISNSHEVESNAWEIMQDFPEKYTQKDNIYTNIVFAPIRYLQVNWEKNNINNMRCYQLNNGSVVEKQDLRIALTSIE